MRLTVLILVGAALRPVDVVDGREGQVADLEHDCDELENLHLLLVGEAEGF